MKEQSLCAGDNDLFRLCRIIEILQSNPIDTPISMSRMQTNKGRERERYSQAFNDETTFILYLTHSHALSLPLPFTERNQWALKHVEGRQQNGKRVHTKHRLKHVLFSKKNTFISCFTTPPLIVHARQSIRLLRLEMGQLCTVY